ncbi:hypothetical protein TRAPUB_9896 [Trametes pubescens]|uniref:Uncharacterized protein n=1 Tax=Trametes pubescens TaxID=154538 RepID=A0A1M2W196_TRAPU|nr:hypothetical protein TRAPUB_9896 [Trametes pubescens]
MAHRCVRKLRLATASSYAHVRPFHSTTSRLDALAVPSAVSSSSTVPREDKFSNTPLGQKTADLRALLQIKSPSPHRVWASYVELLQFYGSSGVPRDIHQGVLRKCSPSAAHLRAVSAKLMEEGGRFRDALLYETRFRDVIRNLRSSGEVPTLEDYHCVLDQFAALGNYVSAMRVLEEITQVGLAKEPETYGLCLRALSYRLTLPIFHIRRPMLVDDITGHCMAILEEMSQDNVAYTPTNVDLAFRILKETLNMQGFAALMKGAYGIDLAYPDRSPLEFWEKQAAESSEDAAEVTLSQRLPTRMPFTCSTLNTALDYLGRAGDVSKMVQLFEVTTNPLPSSTSNPAFNDDEDDDFGVSNPQVAPYSPPHIRPNTTTFHTMLRHIHKARHEVLARHYLLVALEAERNEGRSLREMTRTKLPQEIVSPRVSVTRSLLLSVASLANDNKDVELLRWVTQKTRQTLRRKRRDLDYYIQVRARWMEEGLYQPPALSDAALEGVEEELPLGPTSSRFSSFFSPSSSLSHIDGSSTSSTSAPETKPFDIDLHVNMIRRDLDRLITFEARVDDVLARTVQRIKERLGRRVWGGKNIFLSDVERRLPVSREFWKRNVNFRPLSELRAQSAAPRAGRQSRRPKPSASARAEPALASPQDPPLSPPSASTSASASQGQS